MKMLRNKVWRACFLFLTGLTFLNMSFFIAEIATMKSAYNKATLENIARLFSASLSEEETDSESPENDVHEIDIVAGYFYHLQFEESYLSISLKTLAGV